MRRDEPPRFDPGHRFGKRYRIVGLIGRGGMGVFRPTRDMSMNMEDLGSPAAMAWDMLVSPARPILGSLLDEKVPGTPAGS